MTLVSGLVIDGSGAAIPGAVVSIAPPRRAAFSRAEGVEVPVQVTATADASGFVSFDALAGKYVGSIANGANKWPVELVVPDAVAASFADCVEAGGGEIGPASVVAAQAARADAETAATGAMTSASDAEASALAAQALAASGINAWYPTIAVGRAAVADGAAFGVLADGSDGLTRPTVYRRETSATQSVVAQLPYFSDVDGLSAALQTTLDDSWLVRFTDSERRILGGWTAGGKLRPEGGIDWTAVPEIEVYDTTASGYWVRWLTSDGRVIGGITTDLTLKIGGIVVGAGGGVPLSDLIEVISADKLPVTPVAWQDRLRETRRKMADLAGSAPSETLVIVAGPGDSWTDSRLIWVRETTRALKWLYGNAGPGYVACYNGGADDAEASWSSFASWTAKVCNVSTPGVAVPTMSLSSCFTATVGASVTLTAADAFSAAALHYIGGGSVRYKYGAGAWNNLTLSGAGLQIATLATPPGATVALTIETVSGTVELAGVDLRNGLPGVVVHKASMSGARATDWLGQDSASMQRGFAALAGDAHISLLGINDRGIRTAATFGADMASLVSILRTSRPGCDVLLSTAPEILQPSLMASAPMPGFAAAARRVAADNQCAHLDMQAHFGKADTSDYGDSGRQYMTSADTAHPATKGRPVVSGAVRSALSLL